MVVLLGEIDNEQPVAHREKDSDGMLFRLNRFIKPLTTATASIPAASS
jgi:hypothetical protein